LKEQLTQADALNPVYREICEALGAEVAEQIHDMFKGQQITFPIRFFDHDYLHAKIADEFDGSNFATLAKKYGYSEKTIRRILK